MSDDLPHQITNAAKLVEALRGDTGSAGDFSKTGTGKTRTVLRIIRSLGVPSLVVGPKIARTQWERAAKQTSTGLTYINWEKVRTGGTPLLQIVSRKSRYRRPVLRWHKAIKFLAFDEAHKACDPATYNSAMVDAAVDQGIPILLTTATPPSDPTRMHAFGRVFRLHEGGTDWYKWCIRNGCWKPPWGGLEFSGNPEKRARFIDKVRAQIAGLTTCTTLEEVYPDAKAILDPHLYDVPEYALMEAMTDRLADLYRKSAEQGNEGTQLRQRIEWLRVPVLKELVENGVETGHTVLVFVAFRETLAELKRLHPDGMILSGETSGKEREEILTTLREDKLRKVFIQVATGSESLDMQDLTGVYPRLSLVCSVQSAERFEQITGRTKRFGQKTPALIRPVLCAGTREDRIFEKLQAKRLDMGRLTDADFSLD